MLADKLRPTTIGEVYGQEHLTNERKPLNQILKSENIPNMIFYGPPGTGKTTVANIIANTTSKKIYKLNATNANIQDIKDIIKTIDTLYTKNGILLYLDEIQNFNKKQQQSLLEFVENGKITLIASTSENPYFYVYDALISRSIVFEFKKLSSLAIVNILKRACHIEKIKIDDDAIEFISIISNNDARQALNILELAALNEHITIEEVKNITGRKAISYDKSGTNHYDYLSAFQKSIRGSDVDAALHYLARLIAAGDLISICRRLLVIAAEDIGLAYPQAISIVKACVDSAFMLGFPEARIPLAEAVILLAASPKSNSAIVAIDSAISAVNNKDTGDIPTYLKSNKTLGYKYPHNYKNHYVKQQYLPNSIKNDVYYTPCDNKFEQNLKSYKNTLSGN